MKNKHMTHAILVSPKHQQKIALIPTSLRLAESVIKGTWVPQGGDALMFARALLALKEQTDREIRQLRSPKTVRPPG